jgi:hypothetical protein
LTEVSTAVDFAQWLIKTMTDTRSGVQSVDLEKLLKTHYQAANKIVAVCEGREFR